MSVKDIEVKVTFKRVKRITVYVLSNCEVTVTAPHEASNEQIKKFVLSKYDWIEKCRSRKMSAPPQSNYLNGDTITLWGKPYKLIVTTGCEANTLRIDGDNIVILTSAQNGQCMVFELYRQEVLRCAPSVIAKWEKAIGLKSQKLLVRSMKTKWGVCNTQAKKITLNSLLAKYPPECLDYVALHEIAHLKIPNHGQAFKDMMTAYMPRWKDIKNVFATISPI